MTLKKYLKDKRMLLLLHIVCMFLISGFLYAVGNPVSYCVVILIGWGIVLLGWLGMDYQSRRKYFREMEKVIENLDQRFLLGELMPDSFRLEDQLYKELIRKSNKSVIERIREIEEEQKDYRDYIESWVHEIKAPITGVDLVCENHKDEITRRICRENQRIENYVDMALYYARSEEVYKDYMIREVSLSEIVREVLGKNKLILISNRMQAEEDCPHLVYTDKKWIVFILNQLVLNSVKYRKEEDARICFISEKQEHGISLRVQDNGIGIKKEEIGRIFERGFTGSNGRTHERSTGMGLYLCAKLCKKLGISITADSTEGEGTSMTLIFPVSSYLSKL